MIIAIAIAVVALSCALSFGLGRWFAKRRNFHTGRREFLVTSFTPTLLLILGIMAWQMIDTMGMSAEQRANYMGPALLFIYGAPWFAGNLLANILAAILGLNRR